MKICFISEFLTLKYGAENSSIKSVIDICRLKKIEYKVIHKKSKICNDKKSLENLIKKFDIVHIFGGWTLFYIKISLLVYKLKKIIIVHPMSSNEPWALEQKKIQKKLAWHMYQKKFLRQADLVHCVTQNEEYNIKKLDKNIRTVILPLGINKKDIKKNFLSKINRRCIYFSSIQKKKDLDILIKVWIELKNKDWCLDIVGFRDQKYPDDLIRNNKIRFLEPISSLSKKNKLIDNYDFLALPTLSENFGFAILESLSRGVPVLTTNKTPWMDIQNKNAGWVINYSIIELKLVLSQIFNTQKKEFFIKKKNAIKIASNFSKEKLSSQYLKTYKDLLL